MRRWLNQRGQRNAGRMERGTARQTARRKAQVSVGYAAAFMVTGLGIASCDQRSHPVAPPDDHELARDPFQLARFTRTSETRSRSPFGCDLSVKTSDGPARYSAHRLNLGIPAKDLAANGSKLRYVLHVGNPDEAPVAKAYCVVPNTQKALAYLDRNIAHRQPRSALGDLVPLYSHIQYISTVYIYATSQGWYGGGGYTESGDWDGSSYDCGQACGGEEPYNPDLTPPENCFPKSDTLCLTKLMKADSLVIEDVISTLLTPLSSIPDSTLRSHCEQMANMFAAAYEYNPPQVYRGKYNTGLPGDRDMHYEEVTNLTQIHFDPWLLDSAATGSPKWRSELANSALHGAAHVMGKGHPLPTEPWYLSQRFGPQYISDYFVDLNWNGTLPGQSCIIYP